MYIYDTKEVKAGRNSKYCTICDETIDVGKPSITVTINCDGEFSNRTICSNSKCLDEIYKRYEDDEEEDD